MFSNIRELIEKRIESLGYTKKLQDEERIRLLRVELAEMYSYDPAKEIYFLGKDIVCVAVENFTVMHDLQMRKIPLIKKINDTFPDKKITDIKLKLY